jgi:hypothetical protein
MTDVLTRKENRDTNSMQEEGLMMTEAEIEVPCPQAKECQGLLPPTELGRGLEQIFPRAFRESMALPIPDVRFLIYKSALC